MGEAAAGNQALDYMQRMIKGDAPGAPIMQTLGMRMVQAEVGHAVLEMEVGPHLANPTGTLHGGVLCDIADAAMGATYITTLGPGESYTTLELKINFMRPVRQGKIRADARMLQGGRTIGLVECRVLDAEQRLVAHVISTCMTLRGEQAQGRAVGRNEPAAAGVAGRSPQSD